MESSLQPDISPSPSPSARYAVLSKSVSHPVPRYDVRVTRSRPTAVMWHSEADVPDGATRVTSVHDVMHAETGVLLAVPEDVVLAAGLLP